MNFFVRNRPQRHTAFAVLLAWLFALASGVANACMLQADQADQVHYSQRPHESLAVHAHGPAQQADHEGGSAGHHKDADASKSPCLKVCDDSTHALVKATSAVDRAEPFPAIWVTVLWTVATPPSSAVHGLDDLALPIPGPPLRLCYLATGAVVAPTPPAPPAPSPWLCGRQTFFAWHGSVFAR